MTNMKDGLPLEKPGPKAEPRNSHLALGLDSPDRGERGPSDARSLSAQGADKGRQAWTRVPPGKP